MNSYISRTVSALICRARNVHLFNDEHCSPSGQYMFFSSAHPQSLILSCQYLLFISFCNSFDFLGGFLLCCAEQSSFFNLSPILYYILLMSTEVIVPNQRKTTDINNILFLCWIKENTSACQVHSKITRIICHEFNFDSLKRKLGLDVWMFYRHFVLWIYWMKSIL